MTWRELWLLINNKIACEKNFDLNHANDAVMVYNADDGEFYPADTIEFEDGDDIIDAGRMFISINAEKYSEQKDNA